MKHIITVIALLFSLIGGAQQSYPNKKPELLTGKNVTVRPLEYMDNKGYRGFYSNKEMTSVYLPDNADKTISSYKELLGQTFKVVSVDPAGSDFRIKLESSKGRPVFYKYTKYVESFMFPFIVEGGLTLPDGFYCDGFTTTFSGYTDSKKIDGLIFKTVNENRMIIQVVNFPKQAPEVIKGATIIFEDGSEIYSSSSVIEVQKHEAGQYIAKTAISVNEKQVGQLKANKIVKVLMGDASFDVYDGEILKGIVKCMFPNVLAVAAPVPVDYCSTIEPTILGEDRVFYFEEPNFYRITKGHENGEPRYFVSLYSKGGTPPTGKGVSIQLENNLKINLPEAGVNKLGSDGGLSAIFPINIEQYNLLRAHKMISYTLVTTVQKVNVRDAKHLQDVLTCLATKK